MDWLAEQRAGDAIEMEDYCHSFEHTVELQMIFLQHVLGANVKILPILCGSYAHSIYRGGKPEDDDGVKRFLDALGELREREGDRLFWILGVDMAHMGARYQDSFECRRRRGRDAERCRPRRTAHRLHQRARRGRLLGPGPGAARRFEVVRIVTILHFSEIGAEGPGELLRYEQWNIDERSVVSFAGMAFRKA